MPFKLNTYEIEEPVRAFLYLINKFGFTQKEAQSFIAKGRLFIDNEPMIYSQQEIVGKVTLAEFIPQTKGLEAIYETANFALYDKPSGLLVHPSSRHTPYSLIDEIKYKYGNGANIVHRIDQETSGLVLASKNKYDERILKSMFENREVSKEYLALVKGKIKNAFLIDAPISKELDKDLSIRTMMKIEIKGKLSQTFIKPLKYYLRQNMTLISAKPKTGRQHQIRVHMFHVKHPIVGEPIYGVPNKISTNFLDKKLSLKDRIRYCGAPRLMLHAQNLKFGFKNRDYDLTSKINFYQIYKDILNFK